ncbi:MAG: hypothetical protein C5B60_07445 [Chloroflexi bacterium]|nr:MAG: hypothetical protein C5B60_07445 [Chloroflexota bacterium]
MGSTMEAAASLVGEDEARKLADRLQKSGFKGAILDMAIMQQAIVMNEMSGTGASFTVPPAEGAKPEARVVPVNMTPIAPTMPRPTQQPQAAPLSGRGT